MNRRESFWQMAWGVEAALVGWFFVQAVRFLLGTLYAHVSSADIVLRLGVPAEPTGYVLPSVAQAEVAAVGVAMLVPLLAFLLARRPAAFALSAAVVAVGRVFMTLSDPFMGVLGGALVIGGASLYIAALARQMPARLAIVLVLGLLLDQILRAYGHTMDPTWEEAFLPIQTGLSVVLFLVAVLRVMALGVSPFAAVSSFSGISTGGGLALGALLFLETALFGLPNAVGHWAGVPYAMIAPWLVAATALTLIPPARDTARRVLTLVDVQWRGWFWLVLISLLVVVGNRFEGIAAGAALVVAQFLIVLNFWWVARPLAKETRDVTGLSFVVAFAVVGVLFAADFFTYEYAFVRDFEGGLVWLSRLLRAMRGLGLGVILAAVALSAVPLMNARRRIPWMRGEPREFLAGIGVVAASAALVTLAVFSPVEAPTGNRDRLRVATYNIHGGYSLYFDHSLAQMADTIWESGADVALLQEVDGGRLVSFGVDQAHWLGKRLGMEVRYFPTNEHLQGLAVLSRVPIALDSGALLTSQGLQTGVQRVQIRPDEGVLDVYNTWLGLLFAQDAEVLDTQEQDQYRQLQEVLGIISVDHPGGVVGRVVLGGTFNNTPESPLYRQLTDVGFSDPFDGMAPDRSATLLRGGTLIARFDYLWLRNVLPAGRAVLESDASDHRLAVVELNLAQ
ncbi:MAG: endonuclease/exonuclease/phosphatase family protein [Anaerolineae bacterium]|nr:endonuclease/exonuclease/phosphatase family protein [Anaerolineae bacterium]